MINFFKFKKDINFMSYGKITTIISLMTFLIAVFFLLYRGLNFSIEFTGGAMWEFKDNAHTITHNIQNKDKINNLKSELEQTFHLHNVEINTVDQALIIKAPLIGNTQNSDFHDQSNNISNYILNKYHELNLVRIEYIGPQIGGDLVSGSILGIIFLCIGIVLYLSIRFEWRIAIATIIANLHDVVIILGCFACFGWEFSLSVLAGILAVLGYSVNESVVVFDRIRENFYKMPSENTKTIINNGITSTISRTIITHGCTQMMVLAMFFFGGHALHNFSLALTIGIIFGIYSSVLVAAPIALSLGIARENIVKEKQIKNDIVV